jgi:predicted DNA binding protein
MTFFEAEFKIQHDCPHVSLSQKYPSSKIFVWCNFENEIIEIIAGDEEEYAKLVDEVDELGDIVSRSSDGYNVHLMASKCNCTIKNSVARNAEASNVLHLTPTIIMGGWEYHRVIAFDHNNLARFMDLLDRNGFEYEVIKKLQLRGQLSTSLMLNVDSVFSDLTSKQANALLTAYRNGYFVFPRKMNLQSIAKKERVVRTTLSEHLKKAENKLISNLIPYLHFHQRMGS